MKALRQKRGAVAFALSTNQSSCTVLYHLQVSEFFLQTRVKRGDLQLSRLESMREITSFTVSKERKGLNDLFK